ncbi:MAG: polysulfide reductase NrfD [Nitrospinota bacterium]|nr:polysulfide reductase NrfD [Nitrospinota bacterium]MDH5677766.1 polysulfide reductase NrfD [Nitrospinota bacterium]MDH5756677.1 polysulfide reductase NrfD [Nitrospinota bacterium]
MTYSEYLFPNDMHIYWSLMIVTYPFITGLIAGAFMASALFHVFGLQELKPISRFALLVSLAFMLCATLPLLFHLGHPERALNVVVTPHWHSAMAGFGFIYSFYLVVLTMEIWLSYWEEIVTYGRTSASGMKKTFWRAIALGAGETSDDIKQANKKAIYILGLIGIPSACTLHGYVGFIFGSLKSNPWWSTPLMPQVFLLSAIVSGLALLIVMYVALSSKGYLTWSTKCLKTLCFYLWLAMLFYMISEGLEILFFYYESSDAWFVISTLLFTKLWVSFVVVQIGIGVVVPFTLLSIMLFMKEDQGLYTTMAVIAAATALFEVWMMRWNIVIGGQQFSKSYVGFRSYHPEWLDQEGILTTMGLSLLPFFLLYVLTRILPMREAAEATEEEKPLQSGEPAEQ